MMMMMRRESQSPTVAGVLTELYSVAGAATGSDTACCAGLLACCSKWKHLLSVAWPMMELKVR